jgi:hypothetical protein
MKFFWIKCEDHPAGAPGELVSRRSAAPKKIEVKNALKKPVG